MLQFIRHPRNHEAGVRLSLRGQKGAGVKSRVTRLCTAGHLDDDVDVEQKVVNKKLSLLPPNVTTALQVKALIQSVLLEVAPVTRKVDMKLPGKGNSDFHGARPVHQIISIRWIRTSRLSIKILHLAPSSNVDTHFISPPLRSMQVDFFQYASVYSEEVIDENTAPRESSHPECAHRGCPHI